MARFIYRSLRPIATALACAALVALPAFGQVAADPRIRGTFATSASHGSALGAFDCAGAPVCRGSWRAELREINCTNFLSHGGPFELSGLELSAPGPLQGTFVLAGSYDIDHNADGTCTMTPGSIHDFSTTYTGTWDGAKGVLTVVDEEDGQPTSFPATFAVELPAVFAMTVAHRIDLTATASAAIQYRPQDQGAAGSVYVFALAPEERVQGAGRAQALKAGTARGAHTADAPPACVLAQLNSAGRLVAVSASSLAPLLDGVFSAQGAAVSLLDGVPTSNISGATFFVSYGASPEGMIGAGTNRAAVTVPGPVTCQPAAPQTGWWWNPNEDGRGFSIEKRGNNLFFASFLYHANGRSTWLVSSGPVSLEGSLYSGELLSASGGQTLDGPYMRFPTLRNEGAVTLAFHSDSVGTLVWPGGTVPIRRFDIIPNGLTLPPVPGQPESGWWWNEQESGRGFFMEFQNGWLDIAGYMYDDDGSPIWYLTVGELGGTPAQRTFSNAWWSYGNGMTMAGPWRPHTRTNDNVAPVTITFTGPDTALMTLPGNRTTHLRRHRF